MTENPTPIASRLLNSQREPSPQAPIQSVNSASTASPSPTPRRRRGAQPGNTNSLKHGFYTRRMPPSDLSDLEKHTFTGLREETSILRLFIRRVVELSGEVADLEQAVSLLRVLSLALLSLTRLLRTEQLLGTDKNELMDALSIATMEVLTEKGAFIPGKPGVPFDTPPKFRFP